MSIGSALDAFASGLAEGRSAGRGIFGSNDERSPKLDTQLASPKPVQTGTSSKGGMDPNEVYGIVRDEVIRQGLAGTKPKDGERYGITTGSADEWANFYTRLAYHESGLKNGTVGDAGHFNGGSRGLFQLSYHDAPNYRLNGGKAFTQEQLADPRQNTAAAITISKSLIDRHGSIGGGMGRYWGPISREGWTPGKGRDAKLSFDGSQASPAARPSFEGRSLPQPQQEQRQAPVWGLLESILNPEQGEV